MALRPPESDGLVRVVRNLARSERVQVALAEQSGFADRGGRRYHKHSQRSLPGDEQQDIVRRRHDGYNEHSEKDDGENGEEHPDLPGPAAEGSNRDGTAAVRGEDDVQSPGLLSGGQLEGPELRGANGRRNVPPDRTRGERLPPCRHCN